MKKFFKSIYDTIAEFFDRFFVVLTLLVGLICLYYGILGENGPDIKKLLHTVGSLSLASGIFAGIAKSNQFTEIYKKIIREIIYGKEHLEVRKDLEQIWENVTHQLTNQKFLKISEMMKSNVKKYFLPLDHDYYYDDFTVEASIEFSPDNPNYLIVKETTCYKIICEDEELIIDNKFSCWIKVDSSEKELTTYNLKSLIINNEEKAVIIDKKFEKNHLVVEYKKPLKGQKSYIVKRQEEKCYNLDKNQIRQHLSVWVYNNFTLDITYPKELTIDFYKMGVLQEFTKEDKGNSSFNRFKAEYKGLLYKNQGFFIHLRKK